ncbi:MAG: hypothetical protein IPH54_10055 [Rhodoferax sp.]|nr:hypothetical protein [Rhodoferax sp.]
MGHMAREEIVRSHSWNARVSDMISEIDSILVQLMPTLQNHFDTTVNR